MYKISASSKFDGSFDSGEQLCVDGQHKPFHKNNDWNFENVDG